MRRRRRVVLLVAGLTFLPVHVPAAHAQSLHHHDGGGYDDGDGTSYGDHEGDNNRHSKGDERQGFSPGPFDRSPVDISHNTFCIGPNSCPPGGGDGAGKLAPKTLFPPTPAKILALIQTIFTDTQTFVFGILKVVA